MYQLVGINYDKDKNHSFVIKKWMCEWKME